MAETIVEIATCENCGSDVRENTLFCYNCGNKFHDVAPQTNGTEPEAISDEGKTALEDLAARLKIDGSENDRLAFAAAERKKARVAPKTVREDVWEEVEPSSARILIVSFVALLLVASVVFVTVYWK